MRIELPRIPRWLKIAYLLTVLLVFAWVLAGALPQIGQWRALFLQANTYIFIASWMAMACLLGACWAVLIRLCFAVELRTREWLPIQAMAWGGRYLPGKLGLLAGKLALLGRHGLDMRKLTFSVLWEQIAFMVSGAILAAILLVNAVPSLPDMLSLHWNMLRLAVIVGCLALFFLFDRYARARLDAPKTWRKMPFGRIILLLGLYLIPHLVVGFGCYVLLLALIPDAAPLGILGVTGLLALANVSGIVAVFAPAGIGVREVVLGLGLSGFVPLPAALAFAAVLRLLSLVADALFFVLAGGFTMLRRSKAH